MINENTESKNDQTIITSPTSTINHTVEKRITNNNTPSIINNKWKQISLQGLDITPQETKLKISTPLFHSTRQQVNLFLLHTK
jgi:hypothetical protein